MTLDDPFPIELFPQPVRDAILIEFNGRCPSIGEVASIPEARWLQYPGIGPGRLTELRRITQGQGKKPGALAEMADPELLDERDRLQSELDSLQDQLDGREREANRLKREISRLRREAGRRRQKLRAITAELRLRGLPLV